MEKPNNSGIAKQLRNSETEAEKFLWTLLRAKKLNGVKFRRQAPIGVYVVDFVSFEKKLIIEIDAASTALKRTKNTTE